VWAAKVRLKDQHNPNHRCHRRGDASQKNKPGMVGEHGYVCSTRTEDQALLRDLDIALADHLAPFLDLGPPRFMSN